MLGSLRRALSVLNPFGAADEPPNGVENGGEVEVEVPKNAEGGGARQPVRNVEGRRSRRDLESPAGNHPEGHGDHGRDRTVEGRQADANLNVPLAAASSPGDGVRHGQVQGLGNCPRQDLQQWSGVPLCRSHLGIQPRVILTTNHLLLCMPQTMLTPQHLIRIPWVFRVPRWVMGHMSLVLRWCMAPRILVGRCLHRTVL